MKKKLLLCAAVILAASASTFCQERADRDEIVRALLARSRLLEDIRVRVPVELWRKYLLRNQLPPQGRDTPVGIILEQGRYHLTVPRTGPPTLRVLLRLRIFRATRSRGLAVLSAKRAWRKLTVNGKEANFATRDGWLRFTPPAPGVYEIAAETALAPQHGPTRSIRLQIARTVRTLVEFDSPGAWRLSSRGDPRRILGTKEAGTHGQLALTPRTKLDLRYSAPQPEPKRPPRYQLRGQIAWDLDAGRQRVTLELDVRILGGKTERIDLMLPASAQRVRITGPDVRQASVERGAAWVFLRGAIRERTRLSVRYDLPAAKETVRFRRLDVRDGHWSGGVLVVTNSAGSSEVLAGATTGLRELALPEVSRAARAILAGPMALAYEITGRNFAAEVELVDLGEFALRETLADMAHYQVAFAPDGSMMCRARYEIRNRGRQFVRLSLPKGASVLLARVNDKPCPISFVAGEPDTLLLPLVRSRPTVKGLVSFPVEVVYVCRTTALKKRGEMSLPLPSIDVPIAYAWCEAYVPRDIEVRRWRGPLRFVERYSSETAAAQFGYGRGELAEGYTEASRMKPGEGLKEPGEPKAVTAPVLGAIPVTSYSLTNRARSRDEQTTLKLIKPKIISQLRPKIVIGDGRRTRSLGVAQVSLAKNYYLSGKEFYDNNDYANARDALENVKRLAPKSVEAINADRMLSNIRALAGKDKVTGKGAKAALRQFRGDVRAYNRALAEQQQRLTEQAAQAARKGEYTKAKAQYEAAVQTTMQLAAQGADQKRLAADMKKLQATL